MSLLRNRLSSLSQRIGQWSFARKLFFGNLLLLILPLLTLFFLLFSATFSLLHTNLEKGMAAAGNSIVTVIELSIKTSVQNYLRAVAEKNRQIAENFYLKSISGKLTESEAKQAAIGVYRAQKIGPSGYVYVISSQGIPQYHPVSELEGMRLLDKEQYKAAWPFLREQIQRKTGYLEYSWKNPNERTDQAKALFMEYFQPWDWIIASVAYRHEFESIVDMTAIRERISSFRLGQTGYALLFNDQGEVLVHPSLGRNPGGDYREQMTKVLAGGIPDQEGRLIEYRWQNPGEAKARDKLIYIKRVPQFGLYIGVTVYKDEIFAGLMSSRLITALVVLMGFLLASLASLWMSRHFAAPLRSFARQLKGLNGDNAAAYDGSCEARFLITRFNQYIEQTQETNARLSSEVNNRKSAEAFLQIYKQIFDNANEGILITDADGKILAVNNAFTTITGYEAHEAVGQNPRILKSDQHDAEFFRQMWQALTGKGAWEGEIWNRRKDGTLYPEWLAISSIRGDRKDIVYYFAMFYEIGELKRREKQVAFMAYHDILTRLPNRAFLENKLAKALKASRESGSRAAVFFIDLDNFKNINDVFGHNQGDELLVQVSRRFLTVVSGSDTLCRLGSDEFILLMEQIENESSIYLMANRLQALLKKPFVLEFKKIFINASIGISIFPGDGDSPLDLLRSADMAMHKAKREGKNRHLLFTRGMHEELYEKFRTENGIRYGLLHREFVVHYQPKVNIESRRTASLEALIRWEKGGKLISPALFIPIAEESSLIDDLCLFVLEETCIFHNRMREEGVSVPISVNISPRQFHNLDFVDIVEDLLGRYQVEPQLMEFEITETTAMKDVEHTLVLMQRLRDLGILFSIDDFGTGYSSLGYLSKMPVSTLKIDKQFIDDMDANGGIIATIIAISQQMHLNVVAEGVETEQQLLGLKALGCHEAQGYYFSRPVDTEAILAYLLAETVR